MRGPGLLILAALVTATPAFAQDPSPAAENTRAACTDGHDNDADGHVDCDDQDCQDFTFCAAQRPTATAAGANDLATLRGRGTTRVVIGAVLLSLGLVVGGTSALLWVAGKDGYGFDTYYAGGTAMDVIGLAMIGGGTALLAIGAGNLAEARRPPRVALGPNSLAVRF
jgi:hypothetical protein